MKKPRFQKLKIWIKTYISTIVYFTLYVFVFSVLTKYILQNWTTCISMQFFSQFDGNNILFLVWVASIILLFYDVEAKGWKFRKKRIEDTKRQFDNAELVYNQSQIENRMNELQTQETDGSVKHNEQPK